MTPPQSSQTGETLFDRFAMLCLFQGAFVGVVWGWVWFGWLGAILGLLLGDLIVLLALIPRFWRWSIRERGEPPDDQPGPNPPNKADG